MASLQDSVLDQYGNAVSGATVSLFTYPVKAPVGEKTTDINGAFYFPNLADGKYTLEIRAASITTRIVDDIDVVDAQLAASGVNGLMLGSDKVKLDAMPQVPALDYISDVQVSTPAANDMLVFTGSLWVNQSTAASPYVTKAALTKLGGPDFASMVPQLNDYGLLNLSFLPVYPVGGVPSAAGIPQLGAAGVLDPSLLPLTLLGGVAYGGRVPQLGGAGLLDNSLLNGSNVGGAAYAAKVALLDANGKLAQSMMPTAGGTFRGNIDLTVAYVPPAPAWQASDYGYASTTGPLHSSWVSHLAAPVPTTVTQGDNVVYNGSLYSVIPTTVDTSIYLLLDGSKAMTGPLTLKAQTGAGAVIPTGQQAVGLSFADLRYYRQPVAGDGGTVTQVTDKTTSVSLNRICGQIVTSNSAALPPSMAGWRPYLFTLANTLIGANDTVVVTHKSGGTPGCYAVWTESVAAGAAVIGIANTSGATLSQALTLGFSVFKGVIS